MVLDQLDQQVDQTEIQHEIQDVKDCGRAELRVTLIWFVTAWRVVLKVGGVRYHQVLKGLLVRVEPGSSERVSHWNKFELLEK